MWAVRGLQRLRQRGRFDQPASADEVRRELDELASPVKAFVDERCELGPSKSVPSQALFRVWSCWSSDRGHKAAGTEAVFGRNLRAVVPAVTRKQVRKGPGREWVYHGIGVRPPE
jgi:putative DNA primase/helicase